MLRLLTRLRAWYRNRGTGRTDCPQHHWHTDRRGWFCCWGEHRINAGNFPPPLQTTRLCQNTTSPVDTLDGWLRDIAPGQHRRPRLAGLGKRGPAA